jgi:hypothetical protein
MVLTCVKADLRSTLVQKFDFRISFYITHFNSVYELFEARSGVKSNCTLWTSYFLANGIVRSPVGSMPVVGHDGIQKHCDTWNQNLGPEGNGWYPMELWSGNNEVCLSLIYTNYNLVFFLLLFLKGCF